MTKEKNDLDIFLESLSASQISHNNMWADVEKRLVVTGKESGKPREIIDSPLEKKVKPVTTTKKSNVSEIDIKTIVEMVSTESISSQKRISILEEQIKAREISIEKFKSTIDYIKNKKE